MSGPLPRVLDPVMLPASLAYGWAVRRRNARYDQGRGVERLDRPVISVGNITTGGTGKTPFVRWLVERLASWDAPPLIAMRGYGATAGRASDEALEYAHLVPDVPVVAAPDRVNALRGALPDRPEIACIVLDDGFQHRRLHRDLDLVLVDATRPGLDDRLLPAGHLREPSTALARADAVVISRAPGVDPALAGAVERLHGAPPIAWANHVWRGVHLRHGDHDELVPVDWLRGRRVVTLLGVGNPTAVRRQIEAAGATITRDLPARDHERFASAKLRAALAAAADCDGLVMTGKDWVRTRSLIDSGASSSPIIVPDLDLDILAGQSVLEARLRAVLTAASTDSAIAPGASS